jgi:hypothetical protein
MVVPPYHTILLLDGKHKFGLIFPLRYGMVLGTIICVLVTCSYRRKRGCLPVPPKSLWDVFILCTETDYTLLPPTRPDGQATFRPLDEDLQYGLLDRGESKGKLY